MLNVVQSSEGLDESHLALLHVFHCFLELDVFLLLGQIFEKTHLVPSRRPNFGQAIYGLIRPKDGTPTGPQTHCHNSRHVMMRFVKLIAIALLGGMSFSFTHQMHPALVPIDVDSQNPSLCPMACKSRSHIWSCLNTSSLGTRTELWTIVVHPFVTNFTFALLRRFGRCVLLPQIFRWDGDLLLTHKTC